MTSTLEELVQREVIYCVSTLVDELAKDGRYMEDLLPVLSQNDWESAAIENGYDFKVHGTPQDFCEAQDVEPQTTEAYEHWIVTGWLADRLEAAGEMVIRDFLGLTIWGRATTGQAICMDSVIEDIHSDLVGKEIAA